MDRNRVMDRHRHHEPEPEPCPSSAPPGTEPGPTRWGICSAGAISHDFAMALQTLPRSEHTVVAVAARDLGRAQEFARHFGVPRAYGSYEELAEDPELDVVYVGVVNPAHLPAGLLFLRRGRAVLMEKPMALDARQVAQLVATARERGVFLMEGFWTRFFPAWRRLRSLAAAGALGRPLVLRGELGFPLAGVPRLREPGLGGGALLDLGGYGLQMAVALLGRGQPPESMTAMGVLHPTGVDESVSLSLRFPGGGLASLSFSMSAALPGGAALGGPQGWAQFPSHMNCPTELLLPAHRELFPLPPPPEPPRFPHSAGLRYEAQHVRECLLQGLTESPEMPLAESEVIARLLDQARAQLGVGPCRVTTEPSGVTSDRPVTTEPSGVTSETSGVTTEPSGVTSETSGVTTEPSGVTSETSGVTTEPSGVTSETSGVTTEPSGVTSDRPVTTEPSGVTTEPSGVTSETSGVTIDRPVTTEPSGVTTEPSGVTSETSGVTSDRPVTTEPSGVTTDRPVTTEPSGVTTEPSGVTTDRLVTTEPSGVTSDRPVTTEPSGVTTEPSGVTTDRLVTTEPSGVTSDRPVTTEPSGVTSDRPVTTEPSGVTSETSGVTSEPSGVTSDQPE